MNFEGSDESLENLSAYKKDRPSHGYEGMNGALSYFENILSKLNLDSNSLVLDIGSGRGNEADFLEAQFRSRVVRSDISYHSLQIQTLSRFKIVNNATSLPFIKNCFDVIHIKDAAVHIPNLARAFYEVQRVLKTNGEFIITTGEISINNVNIYFKFNESSDFSMSKSVTFRDINEYFDIVRNPEAYLGMGDAITNVSPPYFKINREIIIDTAKEFGLELISEDTWKQNPNEVNWNQGTRDVLIFKKLS